MSNIIVLSMISLDGVLQAPGAPDEDPSGGFKLGGWVEPFQQTDNATIMDGQMNAASYLLGRKTFEIWEKYWPQHNEYWPAINSGTKYVFSKKRRKSNWENTVFVKKLSDIKRLKKKMPVPANSVAGNIQVWGSSKLIQLLLKNDLVDELWLKIYPVTLGKGKKLFAKGTVPAAFTLVESEVSSNGVIIAHYKRAGDVKTGTITV
ncbi:MAG: dihydrofolate reductase [Chitinophagaceae bacterium]|nr:MAG: dihydrofolate reductase [Chitinophagaceae bacterium]